MNIHSINKKLESTFKQMRSLSNKDYEKVLFNMELLKKKYTLSKFRNSNRNLFEMSFRELLYEI